MLDRLPDELILLVLHLAIPPASTLTAYKQRQKLLNSCCIVSKRFCNLVQPLLWRILFLPFLPIYFLEAHHKLARCVRTLVLSNLDARLEQLGRAAELLQGLEELVIRGEVNLTEDCEGPITEDFTELRSLVLHGIEPTGPLSLTYPNLTSLTLHNVQLTQHTEHFVLQPHLFPSLRALYLSCSAHRRSDLFSLQAFKNQLEMIQVCFDDRHHFRAGLFEPVFATLLSVQPSTTRYALKLARHRRVQHLQLNSFEVQAQPQNGQLDVPSARTLITDLVYGMLRHEHLKSLSLPAILHPRSPIDPALVADRDTLLATCEARGIHIIWRLNSKTPEDDIGLSTEFWEYAKELRRKKEGEATAGAGEL